MIIKIFDSVLLLWFIVLSINGPSRSLCISSFTSTRLYVTPFSSLFSNNSDGSLLSPYSSLQQALDHIERNYYRGISSSQRTTIYLYPTYHFVNTIRLHQAHSRTRLTTMKDEDTAFYEQFTAREQIPRRLSRASISGGVPITNWTDLGSNVYKAIVPSTILVNQLFVDNQRFSRSRLPTDPSLYLQYDTPLKDPTQARYGFQYVQGTFDSISLDDAMVVVYHSWTTSHHYIDRLIPSNRTILFTNPSDRPIGTFVTQGKRRFHIENLCNSLSQNSFCFNNATKTVYLSTNGTYNPMDVPVITPVNEIVVLLAGADANSPIEDIIIDNVAIQHGAWGIGRTQQADSQAAAFLDYASLYIANATAIVVSNVEISHTGSYGVWIKEGTNNINLMNSLITDTGAGGIRIGQMNIPTHPTNSIKILYNEVSYGGNVFPSGVAVISHRATDVTIAGNNIHHHRYTGISIGWEWGYSPSYTSDVLVQGNYIYNTGQHILCDQGGIYTLGIQPGTVITGNVIKNVFSYAIYMWGIYLDEGTSQVVVSNNVVYNTGWASFFQHYGANNTIINNVFARASLNPPPQPGDDNPDGDIHIGLAESHTSLTFTRNIIYDTYQGPTHSAYKSDPNVIASFNSNVYYNPYATTLLFGSQQTSFAEWQKTGQDNDSLIVDPLFLGDVQQCDFFTVRSNSPAAILGFANITKLSQWTPGCDIDDESDNKQFYHW
ncbi:unnamed protein product [Rotaria magnacalcarata]|uniref:Right handed beta helix domain-containing protein n=8 Tax=Rotaria magnacalcarata TaxID=392030 RepID=A0A819Z8Y6_9BILA|nr:unnamed protein product [Rotaria magnacalcarata]CAF4170484.1 unnamed protein product [Rotaria magnacalcarata]